MILEFSIWNLELLITFFLFCFLPFFSLSIVLRIESRVLHILSKYVIISLYIKPLWYFFFLNLVAGFTKLPWLFLILLCSPVKPWTCNPLTQFPNSCDYISVPPGLAPSVIVNPDWQNSLIKRNVFRVWTVFKPRDKGVKKKGNWAEEGEKPRQGSLPKLFSCS